MQPSKVAQTMLRTLVPAIIAAASVIAAPGFAQEAASTADILRWQLFSPAHSIPGSNGIRERGSRTGRIRGYEEGRARMAAHA